MSLQLVRNLWKPIVFSIIGVSFGLWLIHIGFPYVQTASDELKSTDPHKYEKPTLITYPYNFTDSKIDVLAQLIHVGFSTDDTFSVGNKINGTFTIYMQNKNMTIYDDSKVILVPKSADLPWIDSNNDALIKSQLQEGKRARAATDYVIFNSNKANGVSISYPFSTIPVTDDPTVIIWMVKFQIGQSNTTQWLHSSPISFPTIYPYSAKLQAETNGAMRQQVSESEIFNNTITGLTWILAGFVPIGLVAEFWIEYSIENYYYRKENTNNLCKFSRSEEDPNYYHSG